MAEHFYSVQGEGNNTGRAAYFIRTAGCNVQCDWCDARESWTVESAERLSAQQLLDIVVESGARTVVITGGEPLLHDLGELTQLLHSRNIEVLLESSGTRPLSGEIDWICISPKRTMPPLSGVISQADEMKIIVSDESDLAFGCEQARRCNMGCRLFLQPEWESRERAMELIIEFVKRNPRWRISLQTHKFLNIR